MPFFLLYFIFNLFPVVYSFFISFFDWTIGKKRSFIGLGNYIQILTKDHNFWRSVFNTVYIMLLSFPFAIMLGLLVATFLSSLARGRIVFQTINFMPYITTPIAIGFVFSFLFDWTSGIINRLLDIFGIEAINWLGNPRYAPLIVAFMIIWKNTGYYMAMYLAGITTIPDDLYEAAKVDGAGKLATFFKITLPSLRPVTIFIVITSLISGLQLFDEPNTLFSVAAYGSTVGGPERSALTIVWNFYDISFQSTARLGYGSAVACTLFVAIAAISLVGMQFMNNED